MEKQAGEAGRRSKMEKREGEAVRSRGKEWMDGWIDVETGFLPILQDFVPSWGRYPKRDKNMKIIGVCNGIITCSP